MFARRTSYVLPHRPDTAQKFLHSIDFYNKFKPEKRLNPSKPAGVLTVDCM
jgi:hypothetical protein